MQRKQIILYYFHDPMCSWCWGFSAVFSQLTKRLPDIIEVKRVLGGLATDTDEPMPDDMATYVKGNWQKIEEKIPSVKFNFEFWDKCQPRRSTYPGCRAVIAAREQGEQYDVLMTTAIQKAYYKEARNPSDIETLINLASELEMNMDKFNEDLRSEEIKQKLMSEIDFTRHMYIESFPSLVLDVNGKHISIVIDYNYCQPMLDFINLKIESVN